MDSQSSQDIYSQLRFRNQNEFVSNNNNNGSNSDYWSQSSNSQQQPDESLPSYSNKPLLFNTSKYQPRNAVQIKSFRNFYEMQQKKSVDTQQRDILESFVTLLKDCSCEIKNTVESLKSDVSVELKDNVAAISSSIASSEELLKKLKEDICGELTSKHDDEATLMCNLKEEIIKKNGELGFQTEKIELLQSEVQTLKCKIKSFEQKETTYFEEQKSKISQLLQHCQNYSENMKDVKKMDHNITANLNNISNENKMMNQHLQLIATNQNQAKQTSQNLQSTFSMQPNYENNQFNHNNVLSNNGLYPQQMQLPPNHQYQNTMYQQHNNHGTTNQNVEPGRPNVVLPTSRNPLSHFSPLPPFTRKFDINGRPSPTAVVTPMQRENKVKLEPKSLKTCQKSKSETSVFLLSSDSETGQDISDMVKTVVQRKVVRKYKKNASTKPVSTPSVNTNDSICKPSPVQRSIRRYGKIRRNANRCTPSPLVVKNKSFNGNDVSESNSLKKNNVTLDNLWKEAVETKSSKTLPPPSKFMRSSRGSLAMRRKQENIFNFDGSDDDIQKLSEMLSSNQRRHRTFQTMAC